MKKISFAIFLSLLLSACGNGKRIVPEDALRLGSNLVVGILGNCDTSSAEQFSGTCSFTTDAELGGIDGSRNIPVSFELDPGGVLTVFAYGDGFTGAMEFRFERLLDDSLKVEIGIASSAVQNYSASFNSVDASQRMTFFLDVHNGEDPTHVLIWNEGTSFAVSDALVNSAVPFSPWFGHASGSQLSYRLDSAKIFATSPPGAPKYVH